MNDLLTCCKAQGTLIDVRSPIEYTHAHIPGALPLPLFSDKERALIGTTYKQKGKEAAFAEGLSYAREKLTDLVTKARQLPEPLRLYCARGGMRSQSVAWLFRQAGIQVHVVEGGYKAYRKSVLQSFEKKRSLFVIGGLTGSGKTELLHLLSKEGCQILDLEAIANHRGSAFGHLQQAPQPSNEQFENLLASKLIATDPLHPLFLEDEGRLIGSCQIPNTFFDKMQVSKRVLVSTCEQERFKRLIDMYAKADCIEIQEATKKIAKRLGAIRTQRALHAIAKGAYQEALLEILPYYDKRYQMRMKGSLPTFCPKGGFEKRGREFLDWVAEERLFVI